MASRMAVPPRESMRAMPSSIFLMSLVRGTSRKASSLKLTMNTSSCGLEALHQIERGGLHLLAFVAHAAAIVDDDAERNRHVLAAEDLDRLLHAVLKNLEGFLLKVRNQFAVLIENADRQHHQARIGSERWVLRKRGGGAGFAPKQSRRSQTGKGQENY